MWGVSLEKVNAQFGKKPQELILKNIKPYLSDEKVYIDNHHIYLSNKGKLFADGIAAALFLDEDELN